MCVNLVIITSRAALILCTALPMALLPVEAAQAQSNLPVCPLVATGGTIAMKIDPVKQAPVPAISGEDLLATVPEVAKHARVEVKNVSNVPSDYMDPPRWIALSKEVAAALERPEVAGVVLPGHVELGPREQQGEPGDGQEQGSSHRPGERRCALGRRTAARHVQNDTRPVRAR